MRRRIHKSLLLMGIVSVVFAFLLALILHYQSMQEQADRELARVAQTAAAAVSIEKAAESKAYLDAIYDGNNKDIHIVWLTDKGSVLYDTDETLGRNYLDMPEVQQAIEEGKGKVVHKSADDHPKSYVACRTADDTILRFSKSKTISFFIASDFVPEVLLFLLVFFVGCLAAAEHETNRILTPIRGLGKIIQDIMGGKEAGELPGEYEELVPLIHKVEEQRDEIETYLEDIEEERNTTRAILDTISDGIILLNSRKEIVDYNARIKEIFHTEKDKRFRRISFLYHDEDFLRAIGRAYHSDGAHEYTMTLFDHPFRMATAKTELADGEEGLLLALRDMTANHMAEKMRREFSANVSHELKTPLTSISGFAEIIANGMYQNEDDLKLFGSRILNESHRMMSLIDTIMHLSKVEETETTIKWKPVEVEGLIRYAADLIKPQADKKNVAVELETEPVYVYGNAALLSELAMNLLDNAVKYNHDGGRVTAKLTAENGEMVMTVSDTGIGIPADKQDRIFERFYRAEESRNKMTGGSGLGLSICKHIVEKHKGSLTISSIEGEGATFIVTLPAMSETDVSAETDNDILARQEAADGDAGKLAEMEAAEEAKEAAEEFLDEKKETISDSAEDVSEKEILKTKKEKKRKKAKKRKSKEAELVEKGKTAKEDKLVKEEKEEKNKSGSKEKK